VQKFLILNTFNLKFMKKFKTLSLKKEKIANLDRKSLTKILGGMDMSETSYPGHTSGITLCSANPLGCPSGCSGVFP